MDLEHATELQRQLLNLQLAEIEPLEEALELWDDIILAALEAGMLKHPDRPRRYC